MRFDIHLRQSVRTSVQGLAGQMAAWERTPALSAEARRRLTDAVQPIAHTVSAPGLVAAGVDGSGDYPAVAYADSFVYVTVVAGAVFDADLVSGLKDRGLSESLVDFAWLTTNEDQRRTAVLGAFERLAGLPVSDVVTESDYRQLKSGGQSLTVAAAIDGFIIPPAHDAGNLGIQFRTTGELGMARRLVDRLPEGSLVLTDGTMSLPLVARLGHSFFFEHVRRLCCVRALARNVVFAALSKSHGLRSAELLEQVAHERLGTPGPPEHWYLRVPEMAADGWVLPFEEGVQLPPPGAVTYLFRLHRNVPILRLDLDRRHWLACVRGMSAAKTVENERRLFGQLDYISHDQRSFGYPYPIKAGHNRASMTDLERVALRKQIVDAAVAAGVHRSLFRDASMSTGHA